MDINGDNPPNILGEVTFFFYITSNGVMPFGHRGDTRTPFYTCTKKVPSAFIPGIVQGGFSCAAWVIENGNMDYLRCDDLSWDGKHKCSD